MNLKIVECKPKSEYDKAFVDFINEHRAHKTNLEAFHWQFSFNRSSAVVVGLEADGKIVGSQAMMPIPLRIKNKALASGKCENSYIQPDLRGKGKFGELFNFAENKSAQAGMKVLWAFTPAIKPYSKLGFEVVKNGLLSYSVHLNSTSDRSDSLKQKVKGVIRKGITKISDLKAKRWLKQSEINTLQNIRLNHSPREDELSALMENSDLLSKDDISIDMSSEFINWRVHSNPNIKYETCCFYRGNQLVAHVIFAEHQSACRVHFLMVHDNELLKGLVGALYLLFKRRGYRYMTYQGNLQNGFNQRVFALLKSLGQRDLDPNGEHFVYRLDDWNGPGIRPSSWFLNRLWTEGYT